MYAPAGFDATLEKWTTQGVHARTNLLEHLAYIQQHNLEQVVQLVRKEGKAFNADARGGPWASVIKNDEVFAEHYLRQDVERYKITVTAMARTLFDRDTAPGAEPEDLLQLDIPALIVPGRDSSHATSAARYLEECLPKSEYWDVPVEGQTQATVPARLLEFLGKAT